ncbi:MAG: hypothetical protein IJX57_07660 [Clostridia bacterium]|nr:hypothetical protein [Clostridia bacterium]
MKFRAILNDKYDLEDLEREKLTLKPWHKSAIYFLAIAVIVNLLAIIYITGSNKI